MSGKTMDIAYFTVLDIIDTVKVYLKNIGSTIKMYPMIQRGLRSQLIWYNLIGIKWKE